jgi:hypothetical protein
VRAGRVREGAVDLGDADGALGCRRLHNPVLGCKHVTIEHEEKGEGRRGGGERVRSLVGVV